MHSAMNLRVPGQPRTFGFAVGKSDRTEVNVWLTPSFLPSPCRLSLDAARFLTGNGLTELPEGIFDNLGALDWL